MADSKISLSPGRGASKVAPSSGSASEDEHIEGQLEWAGPLIPLVAIAELPDSAVRRDGGSRSALLLQTGDLNEYYCKGPTLTPGHQFIGVNEMVTGRLARLTGVPVRPVELISWGGNLFVGTQILRDDRMFTGPLTPEVWATLVNAPEVAYRVVALDIWTLNDDRHEKNWLGGVLSGTAGAFIANDHDLALVGQGRLPRDLPMLSTRPVDPSLVRCQVLRLAITEEAELEKAIRYIERVDDQTIRTLVGQVPAQWLTEDDKLHVFRFLTSRRDNIRSIILSAPAEIFPNLS